MQPMILEAMKMPICRAASQAAAARSLPKKAGESLPVRREIPATQAARESRQMRNRSQRR